MTTVETQAELNKEQRRQARVPLWRRVTAMFTLAFMTVVAGSFLAGLLGLTALMLLFLVERAIGT